MTSGITVVMATYNGAHVIARSLGSLLTQTLPPEQIVVVDDGSTDATTKIVDAVARQHPDMITLLSQRHSGVASALRRAVAASTTAFVAVADHDDWYVPQRLEISSALIRRTGADMVGGQVTGRLGKHLRLARSRFPSDPNRISKRISAGLDPLPHITMMVRRDGFSRFGSYRDLPRAADLELMLRWAHRGARVAVSPEVLADYSFRPEFFSVDTQMRWMISTLYAREVAPLSDTEIPEFAKWFSRQPLGPPRREAMRRVTRLTGRLCRGMLEH